MAGVWQEYGDGRTAMKTKARTVVVMAAWLAGGVASLELMVKVAGWLLGEG
jgi:hypothetical protein